MAQDQTLVQCTPGEWTQLTNANATTVVFQVVTGAVLVRATDDATSPTPTTGLLFRTHEGNVDLTLAEIFPGGTPVRLWARPQGGTPAAVLVSHA